MKNILLCGAVIMTLLLNNTVFGYFYHACVVKKVVNKHKQQQYIILLGDYHDKTHPANLKQRIDLELLLKKCAAVKSKLIVEDLSSVNNDGRMICCNFGINCAEGVLGQLAHKARTMGIAVDNVEFRYCRVAAIGPLINNIQSDPHSFKSSSAITLVSLHKEVVDELEKMKKYDDGKKLNAFYRRKIADVHDLLSKMRLSAADETTTVAHHCAKLQSSTYRQELEKLCIFDSALIDINIMHSIAACDAPLIFVVAGGSHIEQVNSLLKRIGYEVIFTTPDNNAQPVDISVLDHYVFF